jgi:hypothetical protein
MRLVLASEASKIVVLIWLMTSLASFEPNENCKLTTKSAEVGTNRRPLYLIGHNPNTPVDAIRQLRMGFNALGPDLRFVDGELRVDNQFMFGNIAIQWPRYLGVGPTLESYLKTLRRELSTNAMQPPALIVWDLKPPFNVQWIRKALATIREEFTRYYPNTAIAVTVGEIEGASEIVKLSPYLENGEAIGIDDYFSASQSYNAFGNLGKPYVYADRNRAWSMDEALALREKHKAFPFVFAWTINSPTQMQAYLAQGIDGMMVDEHALPHLCKLLSKAPNKQKFRIATLDDKPF